MLPTEVWEGRTPAARVLRAVLTPASWLYAAGWRGYLGLYSMGLKRAVEPHRPIVCIGNLSTGGSGKTPLTVHIAELLIASGSEVVVGCSGYGGPHESGAALAPSGPLLSAEWGDEPALLRELLPDTPLVVGRARVDAAALVATHHPGAVLLMDDGFQHLPLRKHVSIVIAPTGPNRRCLPAGPLREPQQSLHRADLVLPGKFSVEAAPLRFTVGDGEELEAGVIGPCSALCAIGRPELFFESLAHAGLAADPSIAIADHDPLSRGNLLECLPEGRSVVVTAKDWVKLRERTDVGLRRWIVARHAVRVVPAEAFQAWLLERLDEVESQSS